jgi:Transposase DDE domain
MRQSQSILNAAAVHAHARGLLVDCLHLRDYKRSVPARLLASLMLLAALTHSSLCCACRLFPRGPCYDSARKALHAALPPRPRDLLARLIDALHRCLPAFLRAAPQVMALDLHARPFYGKKGTRGSSLGKRKAGTRRRFAYATLAALNPAGRFTLGLLPVPATMRLTTVLRRLLEQAEAAGVGCAYLMMDKEFCSAEVIAWLQKHGVSFLVPMQRQGKSADGGNRRFFELATAPGWYDYGWAAALRKWDFKAKRRVKRGTLTVNVRLGVARGERRGKECRLVYATGGLAGWSVGQVKNAYRRRFGIESKYRQLGRCLARTSSRCQRARLLWVGVGLVALNVWARLHALAFGSGPLGGRRLHLGELRLAVLCFWVAVAIVLDRPPLPQWPTQRPVPDILTDDP